MCSEGSVLNFLNNTKLLRLALLILPSIAGVEGGFSITNILVSPLHTSLNGNNINWLMHIYSQWGTSRHIHIQKQCTTQNFSLLFLVVVFIDLFFRATLLDPFENLLIFSWYKLIILDWNTSVFYPWVQ